jgi:hypothetical protein
MDQQTPTISTSPGIETLEWKVLFIPSNSWDKTDPMIVKSYVQLIFPRHGFPRIVFNSKLGTLIPFYWRFDALMEKEKLISFKRSALPSVTIMGLF